MLRWCEYGQQPFGQPSGDQGCSASPESGADELSSPLITPEPVPLLPEVEQAILYLKKRKAPGLDGVVAKLIQHASSVCVLFLHKLCLEIWKTGRWPKAWKRQEIVMLPKAGSAKECSNYRTIALMSHASKILLTIILNRMKKKIEAELPDEQDGFRAVRSTVNMLCVLQIIIEKSLEWQNPISIVFIDYR